MREADRKRQLEKRIKYTLCIAVGAVVGIIAGICIGVNLSRNTRSTPMPYTEIEYGLVLEPGELAGYIYDNYWNFIRKKATLLLVMIWKPASSIRLAATCQDIIMIWNGSR